MAESKVQLTDQQKLDIEKYYSENPDLLYVTRKVFNNEVVDGRSKEGRAVREFLVERGLKYKTTTIRDRVEEVVLSEHQKQYILQNCDSMSGFQLAKVLFPDADIKSSLSKESRTVIEYIRAERPDLISKKESAIGLTYEPPKSLTEAAAKVNIATMSDINISKLSAQQKQCLTSFIKFVNSPRVIQIINSYNDVDDRNLFETEFTRFTWDKPDLTTDDTALYIGVCQDIVTNKRLISQLESLNKLFEDAAEADEDGAADLSVRLAETMKAKADEYDKVQKRISDAIKKLSGDRSKRLESQGQRTANILALVEAFQQEDERKRLLLIAKAAREKVKEEADRIESLEEFKARILGVSKEEIL